MNTRNLGPFRTFYLSLQRLTILLVTTHPIPIQTYKQLISLNKLPPQIPDPRSFQSIPTEHQISLTMSTEEDPFEGGEEDQMEMLAPMLVDKLQVS